MRSYILPLISLLFILSACDDTTDTIGSSLTDTGDILTVSAKTFSATSESFLLDSVVARSTTVYLGKMKDPETDSYVTASILTQFQTLENRMPFPAKEELLRYQDDNKITADSCELMIFYEKFSGDSLALMKCEADELGKPVEEADIYYSSFDPEKDGYIRNDGNGIKTTVAYTPDNMYESSSDKSDYGVYYIRIPLEKEYIDKDGVKYNNYGTYIMSKYYSDKNNFKNSYNFIHNVCPGFYIKSTAGSGSMINLYTAYLRVYFKTRYETDTTTTTVDDYADFTSTEEVVQITNFSQDKSKLQSLVDDNSCTYLKTPAGVYTRVKLPVDEIMTDSTKSNEYALVNDTINTVRLSLSRENDHEASEYSFDIPQTLLVLPSDSIKNFFTKKEVANYRTSFIYSFSTTDNSYTFYNIATIVEEMANAKAKYYSENKSKYNWATKEEFNKAYEQKYPDWNKIALIPVTTSYATVSSSSVLTKVANDLSLSSTRLSGGLGNPNSIKVSVIYSNFNSK